MNASLLVHTVLLSSYAKSAGKTLLATSPAGKRKSDRLHLLTLRIHAALLSLEKLTAEEELLEVDEAQSDSKYRITFENGVAVSAYASARTRKNHIRVLAGDWVTLESSV